MSPKLSRFSVVVTAYPKVGSWEEYATTSPKSSTTRYVLSLFRNRPSASLGAARAASLRLLLSPLPTPAVRDSSDHLPDHPRRRLRDAGVRRGREGSGAGGVDNDGRQPDGGGDDLRFAEAGGEGQLVHRAGGGGAPARSGHLYVRCARGREGGGRRGSSSRVNCIRASSGGAWGAPVPAVQPVDFHRVIQEAPHGAPYVGSVAAPANAAERTITAARQDRMRLSMQTDEL
ncbi:hypothetical protein PAA26_01325 [Methanomassiliicoccaceae archaeon COG_1]|nr:hypothetical protein [Methanomassiliicoccaceae archaeon COG_1]